MDRTKEEKTMKLDKKQIFTIPNLLSAFRVILAVVFLILFYQTDLTKERNVLTAIILISAVTDFLDGKIARRFHMVSEVGKILDPVADNITQGVLILGLMREYPLLKWLFVLFAVKEAFMGIVGAKVLKKTGENKGAMWYGKVCTAFFYLVMLILLFVPDIPMNIANDLILGCSFFMALSFVLYAKRYRELLLA